jgi:DNA-binding FadR family transcriptional regulator
MERYEQTLAQLRSRIESGRIDGRRNGSDRLPPERDLAAELGVGRRSLRRALSVLEEEGRISRRQGKGTFVTMNGRLPLPAALNGILEHTNPLEVVEVRLAAEPVLARMAALRASRCDIDRLRELAEETRAATTAEAYERADALFHRRIAEAVRNALFLALFDTLWAAGRDEGWRRLGENGRCYKRQSVYARFHRDIAEAIAARDGERAQALMYEHLSDVQSHLHQHAFPQAQAKA